MFLVCLDLEGVLIPEIWLAVAELTGIRELERTTRDEPDYDVLMRYRLEILDRHGLGMREIEQAISKLDPLPGACAFLDWLRDRHPLVILSDTFLGFARPLLAKLGHPAVLCHDLRVDERGRIEDYLLRMPDPKRAAVRAFRGLAYQTIAAGDSYNDTAMLSEADAGILFRPPQNVIDEFPQYPVARTYTELQAEIQAAEQRLGTGAVGHSPGRSRR